MARRKCAPGLACALATLALVAWETKAEAQLGVRWDCYLDAGAIDCATLANAYAESVPGVTLTSSDATVSVGVRSIEVATRRRYLVAVEGGGSRVELAREVAQSRGAEQTLLDVLALLHRGTVPFLDVAAPGRVEGGAFTLRAAGASAATAADGERETTWYGRPWISGEVVSAGVQVHGVAGGLELNRSTESHRLRVVGDAAYRYVRFDLPGGDELRGGFFRASGSVVGARSLGRGVSVAALGGAQRQPQNNLALRAELGAGVEWIRAPFLATDGTNFGIRYRVRALWDRYVSETTQGHERRVYPHHALGVFALVHYAAVDLTLDLGVGAPLLEPGLWDVNGRATLTFRVAGALEIVLGGMLIVRGGAIHEPGDPSALSPVATIMAGSDFGRLTYQAELSFAYTFGNGALRTQDRRWR
ncbi:MAG: hypothetical protein KF901_27595 [Myxococcales bacterium]|nr:hypothetical protein [Myxococcales bacterium]